LQKRVPQGKIYYKNARFNSRDFISIQHIEFVRGAETAVGTQRFHSRSMLQPVAIQMQPAHVILGCLKCYFSLGARLPDFN
jgi:hypothetical protein